jgi:hypothetical protein
MGRDKLLRLLPPGCPRGHPGAGNDGPEPAPVLGPAPPPGSASEWVPCGEQPRGWGEIRL